MTTDAHITGRSGEIYLFQSQSINDLISQDKIGVGLFAQRVHNTLNYTRQYIPKSQMTTYSDITEEEIRRAKDNGAQYFLYLTTQTKEEATHLIEDTKEDDTYRLDIHDIISE